MSFTWRWCILGCVVMNTGLFVPVSFTIRRIDYVLWWSGAVFMLVSLLSHPFCRLLDWRRRAKTVKIVLGSRPVDIYNAGFTKRAEAWDAKADVIHEEIRKSPILAAGIRCQRQTIKRLEADLAFERAKFEAFSAMVLDDAFSAMVLDDDQKKKILSEANEAGKRAVAREHDTNPTDGNVSDSRVWRKDS